MSQFPSLSAGLGVGASGTNLSDNDNEDDTNSNGGGQVNANGEGDANNGQQRRSMRSSTRLRDKPKDDGTSRFMADFNPERSRREQKKLHHKSVNTTGPGES